jgi:serine phosphatase RsbU (regulator of sigma subunit)
MEDKRKKAILDVLKTAKKRETEAFNYYYKSSRKAYLEETESLLLQLAEEERKHRQFVQDEIGKIEALLDEADQANLLTENEVRYPLPEKPYLKRFSVCPGIDMAGTTMPAELLGGDFVDSFRIKMADHEAMGLLLFDVMGHGVDATHLKAAAKRSFGQLRDKIENEYDIKLSDTREVMAYLNRELIEKCQASGKFISAVYAVVDPVGQCMCYTSAGHDPPLLFRNKETLPLEETDLLLGASEHYQYSEIQIRIEPGDLFVFYTDGISEAENPDGTFFGRQGLCGLLSEPSSSTAEELILIMWRKLQSFLAGNDIRDDLTLALLRIAS